jgi:putative oxygen-independent coproporphyrinogen III oxidase
VPFGVYVHVPFCARRCDYCAFATWTDRDHLIDDYLAALVVELARATDDPATGGIPPVTSVFFGGGTPSLVDPDGLMRVLAAIPTTPDAEITVECNPDTVTAARLGTYLAGGVNRLSFGVQSMVGHVLEALGRSHDPESVITAVQLARSQGFTTFNLDLIYGGAGETIDDWRVTLERALALEPPHISAYALTVEAGTPLADEPDRHPDDDDQADKYELADRLLRDAGLDWYEISNWARPGHECRHNRLYWDQGDYLGVGCAAHSHRDGRRQWNVRTPDRYLERIRAGEPATSSGETLDPEVRRFEGLQLALRTSRGVPADALDTDDPDLAGLVEVAQGRAQLTVPGRLLANEVAVRLR